MSGKDFFPRGQSAAEGTWNCSHGHRPTNESLVCSRSATQGLGGKRTMAAPKFAEDCRLRLW